MNLTILSSRIFTGNPLQPWAEAMRIEDDRIVAVGTNDEIQVNRQSSNEVLELPGRLITPGFVDAHTHFITFGMTLNQVNLKDIKSLSVCREHIRQAAAKSSPGEWIIGTGWNHHLWEEQREPTRHDLDDISPDNPVMMLRVCTHSIWVNSQALQQAGISGSTPEPPGGKIDRDERGWPTGIIREANNLVQQHIPPASKETRRKAALMAQQEMLRFGITGLRSMEKLESWDILTELDQEEHLKLRIYHLLPPQELEKAFSEGIRPGHGSEHLWFGQAKLFADGSLGADTALLHKPYFHKPESCGIPFLSQEELRENVELAYQYGCDVAIHAIGDKALTNALEAIQQGRRRYPGAWRDCIEHVQLFRPQDLELFRRLNLVASMQPHFISSDWLIALDKWGVERCQYAYALKSILQQKIRLQFSSDSPVEPCDPRTGLYAAVTRQTAEGAPPEGWFPAQRLTLEEGIKGYTAQHAWTSRREHDLGELSPGKKADVTIFSQDLFKLEPKEWLSVDVEKTIINGELVYNSKP